MSKSYEMRTCSDCEYCRGGWCRLYSVTYVNDQDKRYFKEKVGSQMTTLERMIQEETWRDSTQPSIEMLWAKPS